MLVDINLANEEKALEIFGGKYYHRHDTGVWEFVGFNAQHYIANHVKQLNAFGYPDSFMSHEESWNCTPWYKLISEAYQKQHNRELARLDSYAFYGVGDHPDQIFERMPHLKEDSISRVITFCIVEKKNEPPSGGWRWEKWGEYIGTKTPTAEYLYHEKEIDHVVVFSGYHVLD